MDMLVDRQWSVWEKKNEDKKNDYFGYYVQNMMANSLSLSNIFFNQ